MRARHLVLSTLLAASACAPVAQGPDAASGAAPFAPPAGPGVGFLSDPHGGGLDPAPRVVEAWWGRLVSVYGLAPGGGRELVLRELVIGGDVASDGVDYELTVRPITGEARLVVLHPTGSYAFRDALARAATSLTPVADKSLDPGELPPFSMAPRNAALLVRCSDLLDPASVDAETVHLLAGYPPAVPFAARVFPSAHHGGLADPDGDGVPSLFPTRIVVDFTTNELEALAGGPPLPLNPVGLPPGRRVGAPGAVLRIPTQRSAAAGQLRVVTNLAGRALDPAASGSVDPASLTFDVVRAFRPGGPGEETGDPWNGFLADPEPPRLAGAQPVQLQDDDPNDGIPGVLDLGGGLFRVGRLAFDVASCAPAPKPDVDVLRQTGWVGAIVSAVPAAGGSMQDVVVRVLAPAGATPALGAGLFETVLDPLADPPPCFLAFAPAAGAPPADLVSKDAQVRLRYSEPMDPGTLEPFEAVALARLPLDDPQLDAFGLVPGALIAGANLREVTFAPLLPLDRHQGVPAGTVHVGADASAADLVGNTLADAPFAADFTLDPAEPRAAGGGLVLRFDSTDEVRSNAADAVGHFPELRRAQIQFEPGGGGRILSRPVSRVSLAADRDEPVPSVMTPFPPGVQTPLSPLGSKLQTLWRYVDLGLALLDERFTNVDVEGLAWAPTVGAIVSDVYPEFSITLAHSRYLPDEALDPLSLFPFHPLSGLEKTYAANFLDPIGDPGVNVHPKAAGYVVSPADVFIAESGTVMVPFPLNRDVPDAEKRYYTWRDTGLLTRGAPNGAGATLDQEELVLNGVIGAGGTPYPPGQVPTVGLPLLMEFRCYPTASGLGLNAFDVSLAVNSSARPNFRAFSTGGFDTLGNPVIKDPDLETQATGGFNPGSTPPGQPTMGTDAVFHIGQVDLVTRVSRSHTIWFDTRSAGPQFVEALRVPGAAELPPGTEVILAFRGAAALSPPPNGVGLASDARRLDPYGDPLTPADGAVTYPGGDASWHDSLTDLDGLRWVQCRITLVADPASGERPFLGALGLAWSE